MDNSPTHLTRASKPISRQGCVGILGEPYHKLVPLPRISDSHKQYCKSRGSSYAIEDKPLCSSALAKARLKRRTDLISKMTSTLSKYMNTTVIRLDTLLIILLTTLFTTLTSLRLLSLNNREWYHPKAYPSTFAAQDDHISMVLDSATYVGHFDLTSCIT